MVQDEFTPDSRKISEDDNRRFAVHAAKTIAGGISLLSNGMSMIDYTGGKLRIAGAKPIEVTAEKLMDVMRDPTVLNSMALVIEGVAASKGRNLQVPKNIAATVLSIMDGVPQYQRIWKSAFEVGKPVSETDKIIKIQDMKTDKLLKDILPGKTVREEIDELLK